MTIHKIRPLYMSFYRRNYRKWKIFSAKNAHNNPYTCSIRVIMNICSRKYFSFSMISSIKTHKVVVFCGWSLTATNEVQTPVKMHSSEQFFVCSSPVNLRDEFSWGEWTCHRSDENFIQFLWGAIPVNLRQDSEVRRKGASTKYDHFMRVSMDENGENEKLQLRYHPQNTTTLLEFLWTKMKKMKNFN